MFVITVIPIARGISKEVLTYMSPEKITIGMMIDVPLRKKTVKAIVLDVNDARKKKLEIKSSSFMLRKVDSLNERAFLPEWIMEATRTLSDYYATSHGAILHAAFSKLLFDLEVNDFASKSQAKKEAKKETLIQAFEGANDFRFDEYSKIIRRNLERLKSTFLLCPTIERLRQVENFLKEKKIGDIVSFHSKISKAKFGKNLEKLRSGDAFLILVTGSFLFLVPENCGTIIIDEENSRWFKMRNRPYLDFIKVAEKISAYRSLDIIFGDVLLRTETIIQAKNIKGPTDQASSNIKLLRRNRSLKTVESSNEEKTTPYEPLDGEMIKEINKTLAGNGNVFIWAARKGYAPIVLCLHCGKTVTCEKCSAPVVLHLKGNPSSSKQKDIERENYFLCHHCGTKRSALETCKNCGSWKLGSFGLGIEKIQEKVQALWPKEFTAGIIAVGTEKAVTELSQKQTLSIIPSIDSLLSLPDFNIDEQLLRTILILKERTEGLLMIRTKYDQLEFLSFIENDDILSFHEHEKMNRKRFGYPPFRTFIRITLRGRKNVIDSQAEMIQSDLEKWRPTIFPAFIKTVNNQFILHILLKLDSGIWPGKELLNHLRELPPWVEVNIDPQSLL